MDDTRIVGFKTQAKYTSVDRRALMALDAEEGRKEDNLSNELKNKDYILHVLAMMCMYLDNLATSEQDIVIANNQMNEFLNKSKNITNNNIVVLNEIIAEYDLIQDYHPPVILGEDEDNGIIDGDDSILDGYDYYTQHEDDSSIEDYFNAMSKNFDDYYSDIMKTVDSFIGTQNNFVGTCLDSDIGSIMMAFDDIEDYEDFLTACSLLLHCSIQDAIAICQKLVDLTGINACDWNSVELTTQSPKIRRRINDLSEAECKTFTRFTKSDLRTLYNHFFHGVPKDYYIWKKHKFTYEETLLIALHYNANAEKFSSMVHFFGGNWCHYTYPINYFSAYIFKKYYHRICGKSLRYWADSDGAIEEFRKAIWKKTCFDENGNQDIHIPFSEFRIFGFVDTMPHSTCAPGQGPIDSDSTRRLNSYQLQRAFYTCYGKKWGMKTQACIIPNGMFASSWCCSIAHNDKGVINLSGLEIEAKAAFENHRIGQGLEYPAMFGDNIYTTSEIVVKRNHMPGRFWEHLTELRTDIEHMFGLVSNLWKRLSNKHIWKLLRMKQQAMKHILTLFFLTNCYTCLHGNKTSKKFNFPNPSIEQYLDVTAQDAFTGEEIDDPFATIFAFEF
jgi:hypothetical protein